MYLFSNFILLKIKTTDFKFHFEQDYSNSYLPYHIAQQLRHRSCSCYPQVSSSKWKFTYKLTNLNSRRILSWKERTWKGIAKPLVHLCEFLHRTVGLLSIIEVVGIGRLSLSLHDALPARCAWHLLLRFGTTSGHLPVGATSHRIQDVLRNNRACWLRRYLLYSIIYSTWNASASSFFNFSCSGMVSAGQLYNQYIPGDFSKKKYIYQVR